MDVASLVPAEIEVSEGHVNGIRHIGTFHDTSIGVISVVTHRVGGLAVTINAMIEKPMAGDKKVIRGEWRLLIQ